MKVYIDYDELNVIAAEILSGFYCPVGIDYDAYVKRSMDFLLTHNERGFPYAEKSH